MTKNNIGKSYAKVMPLRNWNNGPAYELSNSCTPKLKQRFHASTLTFALFFIASYELLLMNRASHLASMKLLGGDRLFAPQLSATALGRDIVQYKGTLESIEKAVQTIGSYS